MTATDSPHDVRLGRDLGGRSIWRLARHGTLWMLFGQWGSFAIQLGTTAVLARVLVPEDFGLVAMALVATALVDQFRSMGLSQAVIQRRDLTWAQVDTLFWVNAAVGALLALVMLGAAPLLAAFYGRQELQAVTSVLAVSYLFSGLAVQHGALLTRQMRFATLARRNVSARLIGSMTGLILAFMGFGYWALVAMHVSTVLAGVLLVWVAVRWRPGRPREVSSTLPLLKFGAGVSLAGMFNAVARQADNLIIGRLLGAGALGLYQRAYSVLLMPLRQIKDPAGAVIVPILGAVLHEPHRYRSVYRGALSGIAHLGLPAFALLIVMADNVIWAVLGPQWSGAVPVFQFLAVAGLCQLASSTTGWLFVSSGRTSPFVAWSAVGTSVSVCSFLIGVQWGIVGVAAAYAVGQLLLTVPSFAIATRGTSVSLRDVGGTLVRPALVTIMVAVPAAVVHRQTTDAGLLWQLVWTSTCGLVLWGLTLALWQSARQEVLYVLRLRRRRPDRAGQGAGLETSNGYE